MAHESGGADDAVRVRNPWARGLAWLFLPVGLTARVLRFLLVFLLLSWGSCALYYAELPSHGLRVVLALAFMAFGVWVFGVDRRPRSLAVFALLFAAVVVLWSGVKPRHDRPWRPEVSVMPRAFTEGDKVRLTGFRHFQFRSRDDFTPRWVEREVDMSHLVAVDFYVSYWHLGPVGHTFLSFVFDNADPVSISIETRPEKGEGFDPLASMFRQFELIYVVGDERDIVGLRTTHRDEDVFIYRVRANPAIARQLFRLYLDRINQLADQPEFYHLLSNSCTINIVRYANVIGRTGRLNFRHFFNGLIDAYLYKAALIDTSLEFEDLRERSHVNEAAQAAGEAPDFWRQIRAGRPLM